MGRAISGLGVERAGGQVPVAEQLLLEGTVFDPQVGFEQISHRQAGVGVQCFRDRLAPIGRELVAAHQRQRVIRGGEMLDLSQECE